jgi:hypothetical protein
MAKHGTHACPRCLRLFWDTFSVKKHQKNEPNCMPICCDQPMKLVAARPAVIVAASSSAAAAAAPSPPPKPLWKTAVDQKSKCIYYYNRNTRESTWDVPKDYDGGDLSKRRCTACQSVASDSWLACDGCSNTVCSVCAEAGRTTPSLARVIAELTFSFAACRTDSEWRTSFGSGGPSVTAAGRRAYGEN